MIKYRLLFISILVTLCASLTAQAFNPPSAFDFMKPTENSELVMSPSGRYIAFTQSGTDKYCLDKYGQMKPKGETCKERNKAYRSDYKIVIYDLEAKKHLQVLPTPENYYVSWLDFASDDRLLANIGVPTTVGRRAYVIGGSRIISIPVTDDKGKITVLFEGNKGVQRANRRLSRVTNMLYDDPSHVMMPARKSGDLDLWKVNVYSGEAERIAIGKSRTFYWYTSKQGKPLLRYDCSGHKCRKIKVYAPDKETGEWTKIREVKTKDNEDFKDSAFFPAALTENENEVIILSDEDEDERRSVKVFNLDTQSYVRTLYEHPSMDVSGVIRNSLNGEYMGAWLYEDRLQYYITDPTLQKHYNALNKFFDNEYNIRLIGYNKAGTQSVVFASAHNDPGGYYIYDFNTKSIEPILSTEPDLTNAINAEARVMKVKTRDGSEITAYHYYPKGQMSGRPLLVWPHGGPHVRDVFGMDYKIQYFVARGYQVVQMNFRGSTGYGKAFEEAGYGEWGGLMQDDVTDVVKYFHESGLATPEKTCIVGYSYGGYVALYGAATTPELYECVVSGGGVVDLLLTMKDDKKNTSEETYDFLKETIGDPKTDKDRMEQKSPLNLASNFEDPVLLIHGEWDGVVEYHQSEKMNKALKKAGKEVQFVTLKEEGHSYWDLETNIIYLESIELFLSKHIGQ